MKKWYKKQQINISCGDKRQRAELRHVLYEMICSWNGEYIAVDVGWLFVLLWDCVCSSVVIVDVFFFLRKTIRRWEHFVRRTTTITNKMRFYYFSDGLFLYHFGYFVCSKWLNARYQHSEWIHACICVIRIVAQISRFISFYRLFVSESE